MSRVINTGSPASLRTRLLREIATVLQEGGSPDLQEQDLQDMVAFIALSLDQILETIEQTTAAWEKRGYWLKADRFRMEWLWAQRSAEDLDAILHEDRMNDVFPLLGAMAGKMNGIQPRKRGKKQSWRGAWETWHSKRK